MNPYGDDMIVDQVIGSAYQVVRYVAANMETLIELSDSMDTIQSVLGELQTIIANMPALLEISGSIHDLLELHSHLSELLSIHNNLNIISDVHGSLNAIQVIADNLDTLTDNVALLNGNQEALRRSYAEAGFNVVGTFQEGFTYVNANDVGIDLDTGKGYTGPAGTVAAGTDPASGGFVDRSGALRHYIDLPAMLQQSFVVGARVCTGATVWRCISNNDSGRAVQTTQGSFLIPLNGAWVGDNGALGLGADSEATDTAAIQGVLTLAGSRGWTVKVHVGDFWLTAGLVVTFGANTRGVAIRGEGPAGRVYKNPDLYSMTKFIASPNVSWSNGSVLLTSNTNGLMDVDRICFVGDNSSVDGVDNGVVTGIDQQSRGVISNCGFFRCFIGINGNAGFSYWQTCTFGKNARQGAALRRGDSQITDCYFHDTRRDATDSGNIGAALYLEKANNINIKGGKVESSQKGIYIYRSQGVNLSGVNFDFCQTHISVISELEEEAYICRSINISNCRFLSAKNRFINIVNNTSFVSTGTVSGCSFARGNSDAYDNNSVGLLPNGVYPANNFIALTGTGEMDWAFGVSNMRLAATAVSIFFTAHGIIRLSGNTTPYITVDTGSGTGKVIREANHYFMTSLPTTGTWSHGDVIELRFPNSSETQSWTCVSSGNYSATPPVWQESNILGAKKASTISAISAAPTQADFNNLLDKLKAAGLMKY